jgi:hypothetical protein
MWADIGFLLKMQDWTSENKPDMKQLSEKSLKN